MAKRNYHFTHRCVVITNEDFQYGNVPDVLDWLPDYYRHFESRLIDVSQYEDQFGLDLKRHAIIQTNGCYRGACLDYIVNPDSKYSEPSDLLANFKDMFQYNGIDSYGDSSPWDVFQELFDEVDNLSKQRLRQYRRQFRQALSSLAVPAAEIRQALSELLPNEASEYCFPPYAWNRLRPIVSDLIEESWNADVELANRILDGIKEEYGYQEYNRDSGFYVVKPAITLLN